MGGDRKNGIGDSTIPMSTGNSRDMRSAVDVPEAACVLVVPRLLPPSRIGDDVAILAQEGLDDLQDARVCDGALNKTAPIEHLVAK